MGEYGDSVAVLDLGTAKIKLTVVARCSSSPMGWRSESSQFELSPESATQHDLDQVFANVVQEMRMRSVTTGVVVATHAARTSRALQARLQRTAASIGPVNVLTGEQEAFLLRTALDLGPRAAAGCEVGGGSVQVVDANGLMLSVPCGTVTLSRRFGLWLEPADEPAVIDYIADQLATPLTGVTSKCLVVGTTKMATFFRCIAEFGRAEGILDSAPHVISEAADADTRLQPIELELILPRIRQARPEDFGRIMPTDPNFMFGGHKLLLVVLAVARLLRAQQLQGSDVSTAHVLAGMISNYRTVPPLANLRAFSLSGNQSE